MQCEMSPTFIQPPVAETVGLMMLTMGLPVVVQAGMLR